MKTALSLAYTRFGENGPPLLIVHGLLGSGRNWHGIAHKLADTFQLAVPDLRNHGASPHAEGMDYQAMAADLIALLDHLQWPQIRLIGHSMGGKVAMTLAMTQPERVSALLVADIAPAPYPDRHTRALDAMEALPLADISSRQDADARLAAFIPEAHLRQFLLQNLVSTSAGYRWRVNLPAIRANLPTLMASPHLKELPPYPGDTLFLAGEHSDYIRPEHYPAIGHCFPAAHIRTVHGAGHWLHVDQPKVFMRTVREFFAGEKYPMPRETANTP